MKNTTVKTWANIALFGASFIWGSSFLVVKNSMDYMEPHVLLAIRFTLGCIILSFIFANRLKKLDKTYLLQGGFLGVCLFTAYSIQTIGILDTTPGKNAFLTAVYCVLVPYLFWIVDKKRPDRYNVIAGLVAITGIGMVSLDSGLTMGMGDGLSLLSGVFYGIHMVAVAKISKSKDPVLLTIVQFGAAAICSIVIMLLFEDFPMVWNGSMIFSVLYLAVFATSIALLLQNVGQKYTNPASASIILSLESVFGVFFSVLLYDEKVTMRLMIGFALIFVAIVLSETKLSFLKLKRSKVSEDLL